MSTPAPKILTKFVYPPIPIRDCDWAAWYAGEEELEHVGSGPTESAAIQDLLESYDPEL